MPSSPNSPLVLDRRTALLLEAVELLVGELAILSARDWENLPDMKKRKIIAASRLRVLRAETEAADGAPFASMEALIADLEAQSQHSIRWRLELIGNQILALQELSIHLRESLYVTLGRPSNRPLGNHGPVV